MSASEKTDTIYAPRYWFVHIAFAALRLLSLLPYRMQMRLGRQIGRIACRLATSRRRVASRNLRLCFPHLTNAERQAVLRDHFDNLGMAIIEMGIAYYRPQRFEGLFFWHGLENLEKELPGSVILLTAHFGALEVGGAALKARGLDFDAVFREDKNLAMNHLIRRGRERAGRKTIAKNNIKEMVRSLREGIPVWYAPDQNYRRKQSAILPFFGVPAMTNTATGTLAKLGKARVIGFFPHRRPALDGYDIHVHPALDAFPGDDAIADTERVTRLIEQEILRSPAQYFWVHRKFKPEGDEMPDVYADLSAEDHALPDS